MYNSHAIYVKYYGATNTRPAKIRVSTHDLGEGEKCIRMVSADVDFRDATSQIEHAITASKLKLLAYNGRNRKYAVFICEWDIDALRDFFMNLKLKY